MSFTHSKMYVAKFGPSLHESHFHDFHWVPHELDAAGTSRPVSTSSDFKTN